MPPSAFRGRSARAAVIVLAAGLRLYDLAAKSLDNDEASSWAVARKPLGALVADALALRGDPHPPAYLLALKAWMGLAGASEISLRLLSVFCGLVIVALTIRLGRDLFSARTGLAAGFFLALSPFLVRYSQDARMYAFGAMFGVAGLWFLLRALRQPALRWYLGFFVCMTLACYSHLWGSFLLPVCGLLIVAQAPRRPRTWLPALLVLAAVGLVFLPYALNAWRAASPAINITRYSLALDQLLHNANLNLVSFQAPLPIGAQWVVVLFAAGVFVLGVLAPGEVPRSTRGWGSLLMATGYLLPLLIVFALSFKVPVYQPKGLAFVASALGLGLAAGWLRVWHWQRAAGLVVGLTLVGLQMYGLSQIWRDEAQAEDWRHAAAYVQQQAGPGDAVLVHLEYYQVVFGYYYHGAAPVFTPLGSHFTPADIERGLPTYTGYDTLWLVQSGEYLTDPNHLLEAWLAARYPLAAEVYPAGISVKAFVVNYRLAALPTEATPAAEVYSNGLTLAGYRVAEDTLPVTDRWFHPPSTWVHVTLYWSVAHRLAGDVRVAVTLEDTAGEVWGGDLPRQGDLRAFYPPPAWQPGELIRQDFDVNTNPRLAPGQYKVVLRVYPDGSDAALSGRDGADWLILKTVTFTR